MPLPNWIKIKWFNYPNAPKILLQVPIKLEGLPGTQYLQLDTGDWKSHIYGYQLSQVLDKNDPLLELDELMLNGSIGNHSFNNFKFEHMKGFGKSRADQGQEKIGILGTDFFKEKVLIIDFKNDRFLISNDTTVIDELDYEFNFIPTVRNLANIIRFSITLNNKEIEPVLYDTGGGNGELQLKKKHDWEEFLNNNKTSNPGKVCASNRSGTFNVLSVDSEVVMQMGEFQYKNPRITYPDTDMYKDSIMNGVLGNKPFWDRCVVLDFQNFRLGISKENV